MAPSEQRRYDEELQEPRPSQESLGIDGQSGAPAAPLLRRTSVRTLHKAIVNRVWPLGRQQPRPPPSDGFWLDDDQVVTCASVLLFGVLSEEASARVWVTHYTYLVTDLQLLGEGDEVSEELQELRTWLRQTPHLVAYVVTQVWGAHWVCLAVDASSRDVEVEVCVYDSKQEVQTEDVREASCTAARVVFEMKFPDQTFPGCSSRVIHVPHEDRQDPRNADCGFHVALFIAEDATRRRRLQAESLGGPKDTQIAPLHNCARSAWLLRRWMQTHADFFFRPHSSSAGASLDREKCREAFEELQLSAPGDSWPLHASRTAQGLAAGGTILLPGEQGDDCGGGCARSTSAVAALVALVLLLIVVVVYMALRR